jgi:hypothetical protein
MPITFSRGKAVIFKTSTAGLELGVVTVAEAGAAVVLAGAVGEALAVEFEFELRVVLVLETELAGVLAVAGVVKFPLNPVNAPPVDAPPVKGVAVAIGVIAGATTGTGEIVN